MYETLYVERNKRLKNEVENLIKGNKKTPTNRFSQKFVGKKILLQTVKEFCVDA